MHEPSASQSRPRLGCLAGTFSPSRLDLAVAVAAVLPGQFDDIGSQPLLVVTTVGRFTLRRAMLSERRTRTTLGYLEFAPNVLDHGTPARGA